MYSWLDLKSIKPIADDEEIQLITRSHPIVVIMRWLLTIILVVALLAVGWSIQAFSSDKTLVAGYWALINFLLALLLLALTFNYHNYYLSKQVITNYRIIDVDQTGLFAVKSTDVFINQIEEVNFKQTSLWETMFNYGSVDIETAGTPTELAVSGSVFENIPNPRAVVTLPNRMQHQDVVKSGPETK